MSVKRSLSIPVWTLAVLLYLFIHQPLQAATARLQVTPDLIRVGVFYNGATVHLTAEIPQDSKVMVEVTGKDLDETVVHKVRRFGLWMNGEPFVVKGAPSIYFVLSNFPDQSSKPDTPPLPGYEPLKKQITFSDAPSEEDPDRTFKEFVQLKEKLQLYGTFPDTLHVAPSSDGLVKVDGTFTLPSNVPQGGYQVSLHVIQNGQLVHQEAVPFQVEMVGFPKLISYLAKQHGAVYGVLAIAIAALAGLIVGQVFAKSKSVNTTEE